MRGFVLVGMVLVPLLVQGAQVCLEVSDADQALIARELQAREGGAGRTPVTPAAWLQARFQTVVTEITGQAVHNEILALQRAYAQGDAQARQRIREAAGLPPP